MINPYYTFFDSLYRLIDELTFLEEERNIPYLKQQGEKFLQEIILHDFCPKLSLKVVFLSHSHHKEMLKKMLLLTKKSPFYLTAEEKRLIVATFSDRIISTGL